MKRLFHVALWSAALLSVPLATSSCESKRAVASAPARPVEVGVVTMKTEPVTLTTELPGRTSAFRVAEVRARVNGIVLKRLFTEGSDVKEGQALYEIDPAPYQAALDSAQATLRARRGERDEPRASKEERYKQAGRDRRRSASRTTTTRSPRAQAGARRTCRRRERR